jgi:hypothetical protein
MQPRNAQYVDTHVKVWWCLEQSAMDPNLGYTQRCKQSAEETPWRKKTCKKGTSDACKQHTLAPRDTLLYVPLLARGSLSWVREVLPSKQIKLRHSQPEWTDCLVGHPCGAQALPVTVPFEATNRVPWLPLGPWKCIWSVNKCCCIDPSVWVVFEGPCRGFVSSTLSLPWAISQSHRRDTYWGSGHS